MLNSNQKVIFSGVNEIIKTQVVFNALAVNNIRKEGEDSSNHEIPKTQQTIVKRDADEEIPEETDLLKNIRRVNGYFYFVVLLKKKYRHEI